MIRARAQRLLHGLRGDRRGLALIEFALVLPVLVLLFVGSVQILDAYSAYRKVTTTVRTLADLTTQSTSLTTAQADDILNASQQVMAPYSTTTAQLRITQIQVPATLQPTVVWSRAVNRTPYAAGSSATLPANLLRANTYLIYSEIRFDYVPGFASRLIGPITFADQIYMSPRNSTSVQCSSC